MMTFVVMANGRRANDMTVKELKKELEYYDDDMNVVFEVCDDFEPDSITESKYGWRKVHLDAKVKPYFISDCRGEMLIQLDKVEE